MQTHLMPRLSVPRLQLSTTLVGRSFATVQAHPDSGPGHQLTRFPAQKTDRRVNQTGLIAATFGLAKQQFLLMAFLPTRQPLKEVSILFFCCGKRILESEVRPKRSHIHYGTSHTNILPNSFSARKCLSKHHLYRRGPDNRAGAEC
jgi:hypothetical protein